MSWVIRITARPRSCLQLAHQVEDLRLRRDVERGRRLVGDQDARLGGERQRDHHALAQAARELERSSCRRAGRGAGCRPGAAARRRARGRARLDRSRRAGGSPRSAGCRSCGRPRASSSAPGRRSRSRRRGSRASSRPWPSSCARSTTLPSAWRSRISPASTLPGRSTMRRIERAVTLLPQPLSPTMPSVWPGSRSKRRAVDRAHDALVLAEPGLEVAHRRGSAQP